MISERAVKQYCCDDISLIENYEAAVNDTTQKWDCHHRLEITDSGVTGMKELIAQGLYYNRPANELVFLTKSEHCKLHNNGELNSMYGKHRTDETRAKISASLKGKEGTLKGKHHTEETKAKIRASLTGKVWYNNGSTNILVREGEQPDGFVRGILK